MTLSNTATTTSLHPRLSSDGSLMSWMGRVDGELVSWTAPVDDPLGRELCRGCRVVDFFADGEHVLVGRGRRLSRLTLEDGEETPVLELDGGRALLDTDLSRDDRWLALQVGEPDATVGIFVVPVDRMPVELEDWIRIAGGSGWSGAPRWSASQDTIYFISDRDDFLCVWGQSLDPTTKRPVGEAFPVVHAHSADAKMVPFARRMWTLEVGADRLIFNAGEMSGDVYTAQLEPRD